MQINFRLLVAQVIVKAHHKLGIKANLHSSMVMNSSSIQLKNNKPKTTIKSEGLKSKRKKAFSIKEIGI